MNTQEKIAENLKNFLKIKFGRLKLASESLGISPESLSRYVNGKSKLPQEIINKLVNMGLNPSWLLSGIGEMQTDKSQVLSSSVISRLVYLDDYEGPEILVPYYATPAKAGNPAEVESDSHEMLNIVQMFKGCFMVEISGDSMEGDRLFDGCKAIFKPRTHYRTGDIVLAEIPDRGYTIKRLRNGSGYVLLEPSNPEYEPIKVVGEVRVVGALEFTINKHKN